MEHFTSNKSKHSQFRHILDFNLLFLIGFSLSAVCSSARGGTFYDGDVTIEASGSLWAEGTWASGPIVRASYNAAALVPGEIFVADNFQESTRESGMSNATYILKNSASAQAEGSVTIGNGSAKLDLYAEATTSASLSSSDHLGLRFHNNTQGSASVYGKLRVVFPSLTQYSVWIDNPGVGSRYVESTGMSLFKEGFDSSDATSYTSSPAGVPGSFSASDNANGKAYVQLIILYGKGATQRNAILPSGPPTHSATAPAVISNTIGSNGPSVSYKGGSTETFTAVNSGRWYDPAYSYGFVYEALDESLFTEIRNFPDGFSGNFSVWAEGQLIGKYQAGDFVRFEEVLGHGVTSFAILDIIPIEDGEDLTAFPIHLDFNEEVASFRQHAVEPKILPSLGVQVLPDGRIKLNWSGPSSSILEQSDELFEDSWSPVPDQELLQGDNENQLILDPVPAGAFFRLRDEQAQSPQ